MYGGGDAKLGSVIGGDAKSGKNLKEKFLKAVPAIKKLRDGLERTLIKDSEWFGGIQRVKWNKRKHPKHPTLDVTHCIIGLDGRPVYVRSPHSALNTLLQSAGALVCKAWVVETERMLREEEGFKHGWDGDFALMAWVHDEIQVACRTEEIAKKVVVVAQQAMRNVQQKFGFKTQLDTEGKIGKSWKDCH